MNLLLDFHFTSTLWKRILLNKNAAPDMPVRRRTVAGRNEETALCGDCPGIHESRIPRGRRKEKEKANKRLEM